MIETEKFLVVADDIGVVTAGTKVQINLEAIRAQYGINLNTLTIVNNDAVEISWSQDGVKIGYIAAGDAVSFDWQDGIKYSILEVTNEDGATSTVANKIRITVGRTGNI